MPKKVAHDRRKYAGKIAKDIKDEIDLLKQQLKYFDDDNIRSRLHSLEIRYNKKRNFWKK